MLCCEIPQLVCKHQRNVTPRSNVIKKKNWIYVRLWLFCTSCNPFSCFFPFLFFPFPNSPLSPVVNFCPASLVNPYLFIFPPPPLLLFKCFRHATSSFSLCLIEASTEGALWACFLCVGPHWPPASESCACIKTSAWPCGVAWRVLTATGGPGSLAGKLLTTLCSYVKRSGFEAWA